MLCQLLPVLLVLLLTAVTGGQCQAGTTLPLTTKHPANSAKSCNCPPVRGRSTFRVLAFGDSLTYGFMPTKNYTHPYTIILRQLLNTQLKPCNAQVNVTNECKLGNFKVA